MPVVTLSTTRRDMIVIKADDVLALLRGAGFDIPANVVLEARVKGEYYGVDELYMTFDHEPTTQKKKVDRGD